MKHLNPQIAIMVVSSFFLASCAPSSKMNTITIKRDSFGTPHIYASDNYGLFYGYGYSLAQDRLYQMEMLRRSTQGTVSEVLGETYVGFDRQQRTLFWPDDIQAQLTALDKDTRNVFKGFAAGLNAYTDIVLNDENSLLPLEFSTNNFRPQNWTEYDVVMLFVGTMLLRYGDFNTEIANANFLSQLINQHGDNAAHAIFDMVNPTDHKAAPTTIKQSQNTSSSSPRQRHFVRPEIVEGLNAAAKPGHGFSNAVVLGAAHLKDAKAVLLNGPQFGWYTPAYTYSFGLHSPDWEAVGNAPLGYPLPMFGYNKNISWGSTWGAGDNVDIFVETLNSENPNQYKYKGQWKTLQSRQEILKVKDQADVPLTLQRSVHGPLVQINSETNRAYAKRRGWAGKELQTLTGWMDATKATHHDEWKNAVGKSALNVNWYYADRDGNIAYMSAGAYPKRAPGHDNRLPVSGEGDMDWLGIHPPSWNPQILNPKNGYLANWNNKPRKGFPNPDEWWYSWSEADRIKTLDDAIAKAGKMDPEQAWDLMMETAYVDPNVTYFKPLMLAALTASGNPKYADIHEALQNWDGRFQATHTDGTALVGDNRYQDGGIAIFRTWLGHMLGAVLGDDLPGPVGKALSTGTAYGTPLKPTAAGLNISVGNKLLFEILNAEQKALEPGYDFLNGRTAQDIWIEALEAARIDLEQKYGPDIKNWLLPVPATRFNDTNFLKTPQALSREERDDMPDMNRGTENNMTVFSGAETPIGYEIVAPGQSGFIAPDGTKSPHYEDQYELFRSHGKKRTWLSIEDVDANTTSTVTLSYIKD
jgi:penicillin amidase